MDRKKVIKFLQDAIEYFKTEDEGVYYMPVETPNGYDRMWGLVVGWVDYGQGLYKLCVKLAENVDDLQCDYHWDWNMPILNDDVYETECELEINDIESIADSLIGDYKVFTEVA